MCSGSQYPRGYAIGRGEIPQRLDSGGHRMVGGILGVFDRHGYHSYLSVERWTELFEPAHGIDLHSIDDFAGKAAVGVKSGHYMQAVVLQSAVGYEGRFQAIRSLSSSQPDGSV